MRLHGMTKDAWKRHLPASINLSSKFEHYDVSELGLKYNMIDINSSIGIEQLKKLKKIGKKDKRTSIFIKKDLKVYHYYFRGKTVSLKTCVSLICYNLR